MNTEKNQQVMQFTITDEPFAVGYMQCESDSVAKRVGAGLLAAAKVRPISLRPGYRIAGLTRQEEEAYTSLGVYFRFGCGIDVREDVLAKKAEDHPGTADEYRQIASFFRGKSTVRLSDEMRTATEQALVENNTLWGGGWGGHANVDFGAIVHKGTDGIREKIAAYRPLHPEKSEWYDGLEYALDALDVLGARYRVLAEEAAKVSEGEEQANYERIAAAFSVVPKKPACDFLSAVQSFYLLYTFDGVDSPGYFDQYMYPYYKDADKAEAREILSCLWELFQERRAWNLCIGGSDENWNDRTNDLSYEILSIVKEKKYNTPNLTLRWHRNTSDKFLRAAVECLATGCGLPALYNDEAVCPALEAQGIPAADSHLYAMNGCNQIDIQGKSHMGLEDGEVCMLKCLEYALTNGVCLITEKRLAPKTGDASQFTSYEQLWEAFCRQVDYATEVTVNLANRSQKVYAMTAENPLRSAFMDGCIEKGKDYCAGGPLYNHGQILTEGLADAADALTAIKHFVFDTHTYTMAEVVDALQKDYAGYDEMYLRFRNYEEKFGNDKEEPDRIAAEIQTYFFRKLTEYRTWRDPVNGMYGGGMSTYNRAARYGGSVGASANGRHKGDLILADSIGATPGRDKNGPTAALCSALKYNHKLATSGFVMQMKFDKKLFSTEEGMEKFMSLVKGYFMGGGQQLSINVLDPEALRDAQIHPEKYENLIVRVGGYSEYFCRMGPDLQNNIIERTVQGL